jgi:hypothetical protein
MANSEQRSLVKMTIHACISLPDIDAWSVSKRQIHSVDRQFGANAGPEPLDD